ncbi:lysozyme inhibitor LprI family protein [Azospirillum isscasi]|uniref:Lysozyme inhibitor LprI family protein n=1 Tax=Azospirillum isscasi TaxID=3053926 RepID=A0ABU0WNK1_9PROT|nr:lysozyme inhibitor LprI family protein [Azospirillum isscasi]MDQ2105139.1 lysozyme inhibitor LprI family protein [Azospirillum isscasi]
MLRPALLALGLLALPSAATAAGFPCSKANTPTEKAICADPALSALDDRLSASYRAALDRLSGASPEEGAAGAAVKTDQRAWLRERDSCGADPSCLRRAYEGRVAVLSFRTDPAAPSPAGRYVGRFDHEGFMDIAAVALRDGTVAVSVSGAEPTAGRWVCDFSGVGRLDGAGRLAVGTPDATPDAGGGGLILEAGEGGGITIPDLEPNRAASGYWCGHNGSFIGSYRRVP